MNRLTQIILIIFLSLNSLWAQNEAERIEAEEFENIGDFEIENKAGASQFKVLRAASDEIFSVAKTAFAFQSGIYTVQIAYLDEGDGISPYKFLVDGSEIGTWEGDQVPKNDAFVVKEFQGISLQSGQTIEIQAKRQTGEWGRIDYVDFILEAADDGSSYIFEAEESNLTHMAVNNSLDGYTGTAYTEPTAENGAISFTFDNDSAGYFNFKIRYKTLGLERTQEAGVSINGSETDVVFMPVDQFEGWHEQVFTTYIEKGENTIELTAAQSEPLPVIDRFLLQRTNPETVKPRTVNQLLPLDGQVMDDDFIISWLGSDNATSYRVYLSEDATFDEEDVLGETAVTAFEVDSLPDATYYWQVEAVNPAGNTFTSDREVIFKAVPSVYFVSPDGDNNNPGTIDEPLQTITAAMDEVLAGDTVYLREGTYRSIREIKLQGNGSADKYITVSAYRNEKVVFSFINSNDRGIEIDGNYIHLKGIDITNAGDNGIYTEGHYNIIELCNTYKNGDSGIQFSGGASHNLILNCDSYLNYDPDNKGENADGYAAKFDLGPGNRFIGCRAWGNSDDGWDFWQAQPSIYLEGCQAFANGFNIWDVSGFNGDGNGFKLGGDYYQGPHKLVRCVAFDNRGKGFDQNHNMAGNEIIHCTSYNNRVANYRLSENPSSGTHRLVNNISYDGGVDMASTNEEITNSWNIINVSAEDFASLDTTGVRGSRQADGSLPELYFLRLSKDSEAIDKGTDIDWDFEGEAPDLGAYEGGYERQEPNNAESLAQKFSCYPNPVSNTLHINMAGFNHNNVVVSIINSSGQTIWNNTISSEASVAVDVNSYTPGIYAVKVSAKSQTFMRKIIIQ
jgi:hypothetical protein